MAEADIEAVRQTAWFYAFELPDGSLSPTPLPPEVLHIHSMRRDRLRRIIAERIPDAAERSALDLASHEGYFTFELARRFRTVRGIEVQPALIERARLMQRALGIGNAGFLQADLAAMAFDPALAADLVLAFGLFYHLDNPVHAIGLACRLARRHILIETQVFPFDLTGPIDWGRYDHQKPVLGVFALCPYDAGFRDADPAGVVLVPSVNALRHLLGAHGFTTVEVLAPEPDDPEQFRRGSRVMIYGCRPPA